MSHPLRVDAVCSLQAVDVLRLVPSHQVPGSDRRPDGRRAANFVDISNQFWIRARHCCSWSKNDTCTVQAAISSRRHSSSPSSSLTVAVAGTPAARHCAAYNFSVSPLQSEAAARVKSSLSGGPRSGTRRRRRPWSASCGALALAARLPRCCAQRCAKTHAKSSATRVRPVSTAVRGFCFWKRRRCGWRQAARQGGRVQSRCSC